MEMRIIICDDEIHFLRELRREVVCVAEALQLECEVKIFTDGKSLIEEANIQNCDMLVLDIDMPEMDGFAVAEEVKKVHSEILVVFCTSHSNLVYDSFKCQPFWFLCKEDYQGKLKQMLEAGNKKITANKSAYTFRINGETVRVEVKTIKYITISNHKVYLHIDGEEVPRYRASLSEIEKELKCVGFVRADKSCLVNLHWVKRIDKEGLTLKDGTVLEVSRRQRPELELRFQELVGMRR